MKIPLAVPNLSGNEAAYLQDCIDSTFVSSVGAYVDKFERAIADVSGTEDAVVVSSGTVALQMALQGLGIGEDDLVIIPTLTFIATANAVRHTGAQVWIADVEPSTWTIDLELVREASTSAEVPEPAAVEGARSSSTLCRMPGKLVGVAA